MLDDFDISDHARKRLYERFFIQDLSELKSRIRRSVLGKGKTTIKNEGDHRIVKSGSIVYVFKLISKEKRKYILKTVKYVK